MSSAAARVSRNDRAIDQTRPTCPPTSSIQAASSPSRAARNSSPGASGFAFWLSMHCLPVADLDARRTRPRRNQRKPLTMGLDRSGHLVGCDSGGVLFGQRTARRPDGARSTIRSEEMGDGSGRPPSLTVITPLHRGGPVAVRLAFWLGDRFPALLEQLRRLSFIHFARWTVITKVPRNGGQHPQERLERALLLFESDFDGDWDEYIAAFSLVVGSRIKA